MPVTMNIRDNGRIIHIEVAGQWTLADALALSPRLDEYCRTTQQPVHLIVDLTRTDVFPDGLLQIRRSSVFSNPNIQTIAYVGNLRQQIFSETVNKLAHSTRNRYFGSVEEAIASLRKIIQATD